MSLSIGPRWGCSFFFAAVGIAYGSVMSRMPALKAQAALSDADVGIALLSMGLGGLFSFPLAGWLIARTSCHTILTAASVFLLLLFPCMGMAQNFWQICILFASLGFAIGLNDVSMNASSILVEARMKRPVLSSMHALYSTGGLLGSLIGSAMAASGIRPLWNFTATALVLFCMLPLFAGQLLPDVPRKTEKHGRLPKPPLWILIFGTLMLCAYSAEGSVGEWGVLLLHEVKGASEETAALVYAAFSVSMVFMRFFGDRLRESLGDARLMRICAACALSGILIALFSPWPAVCLMGYVCMGAGLSVIVPILFSAAGRHNDIPTGTATAFLSMLAASGQLFVPPLIGMLGAAVGLQWAMSVVIILCTIMVAGAGVVRR